MVGNLIRFNVYSHPNGIKKPSVVTEHDGEIRGVIKVTDGNVAVDAFLVKENRTDLCYVVRPYNILKFR